MRNISIESNRYNSHKTQTAILRFFIYLTLAAGVFFVMIPFAWMLSTSLKTSSQIFTWPIEWIPNPFQWVNYVEALTTRPYFRWMGNTVFISIMCVIGDLISACLAGYAFSRLRWRARDALFLVVLATMMLPRQVTLIPTFLIFKDLGWINSFLPLIVPSFFGERAFNIFLMRQFMRTLPTELDDAAKIDGSGYLGILTKIIIPQSLPILGFIGINTFRIHWNDFFQPLIYLNDPKLYTIPLGLRSFKSEFSVEWSQLMAASVVAIIPLLIIFFIGQRRFIQGVVFTGIEK